MTTSATWRLYYGCYVANVMILMWLLRCIYIWNICNNIAYSTSELPKVLPTCICSQDISIVSYTICQAVFLWHYINVCHPSCAISVVVLPDVRHWLHYHSDSLFRSLLIIPFHIYPPIPFPVPPFSVLAPSLSNNIGHFLCDNPWNRLNLRPYDDCHNFVQCILL